MFNLPKLNDKNIKQWLTQLMEQTQAELNSIDLDNMTDSTRILLEGLVDAVENTKNTAYPVGAIVIYQASDVSDYGTENLPSDIYTKYGGLLWRWNGTSGYTTSNGTTRYNHYFERIQ